MSEIITIDGVKKKRGKDGYFRGCPYNCDTNTGYPRKKWKTEKGIRGHASKCDHSPTKIAEREAAENARLLKWENEALDKIAKLPFKVGDTIHYWFYTVTKPTHIRDYRGRTKRVRYEEERRYDSATVIVESLDADNWNVLINNDPKIKVSCIASSADEAIKMAIQADKEYKDACEFAARCR